MLQLPSTYVIIHLGLSGYMWANDSQHVLVRGKNDRPNECSPVIAYVMPNDSLNWFKQSLANMYLEEKSLGNGEWVVQLYGEGMEDGRYSSGYGANDVYRWKVYESTGTVERIDVDRDYC